MLRRLSIVGLLFALSLGLGWPLHWRAMSRGKANMRQPVVAAEPGGLAPHAATAGSPLGRAGLQAQERRYEFVEHVIDYQHPCDDTGYPNLVPLNSAQATYNFTFNSSSAQGCTTATIPDGKITLNFPNSFTEGVPFTPAVNISGTLQLKVDAQNFTVRGRGLIVDTVVNYLPKLVRDTGVDQDLRSQPCPLARFRRPAPLSGGTDAAPGSNPFSLPASCSIKAPDLFQNFDFNLNPLIISTIYVVVGEDPLGQPDFFSYRGIRVAKFTVTSKYRLSNSCPASGLQAASAPQLAPRIDVAAEITASKDSPTPIVITALKEDGTFDPTYSGTVQVSLAPGTTDQIGVLKSGTQSGTSLSLAMIGGKLTQPLALQTPKDALTDSSVLKPGDPVLKGKAVIEAALTQSGGCPIRKEVMVRSPLDLKIDHIEVQQGVKEGPGGLWIGERDLLVRVFLDANRQEFDKYSRIEGITAKLSVKDQAGSEIAGAPFALSKGQINNRNEPDTDYTFVPKAGPTLDGSESLNYVFNPGFAEQLSLEVKLDTNFPDLNPDNNSAPYGPLKLGISRSVTIMYSRLRVLGSTSFPNPDGVEREKEFIKQAWPVSPRALRFVEEPDEARTTNPLNGDPLSRVKYLGFWMNAFSKTGVRYVYFVDKDYFNSVHNKPCTDGNTPAFAIPTVISGSAGITTLFSVVNSDRCAKYPDKCGVLAHELGHTFYLGDTYTGGNTFVSDHNPRGCNGKCTATPNGNLAEPGHFSWFHHQFVGNPQPPYKQQPPYVDFMGNGGDYPGVCHGSSSDNLRTWTDLQTWEYLKSKLLFTPQSPQSPQAERDAAGTFVIVQGQVNKNGTATLSNCYTLPLTNPENNVEPGDYVIETLDANSAVLGSLNFTPAFGVTHLELELEQFDFSFALPFSTTVRQIRLRRGGAVLATRSVSANAPAARFLSDFSGRTLTGTQQVAWTGSDLDGDALTYDLFYSPDGQLRIPLTETTATSYAWKTDAYPSGPSPMLTLVVTDGVQATVVDSLPFKLPDRPPRVTILSPADQSQFQVGEAISLEGSLFDPEEDLNLNPRLTWSSDLQGALGTGKQILAADLKAGTHHITAIGADSQGNQAVASVTVTVRPDSFSNIAVAPTSVDFGSVAVGQTRSLTLEVRNSGNAAFTVSAMTSNNPQFSVTSPAVPFTVAARSPQTLAVRFTPSAPGAPTGTLTLTTNASNSSSLVISLSGKATGASPVVTVSAASFSRASLASESIVAAFGTSLATATQAATTLPLPTQMAGTRVLVRDSAGSERPAPLFFVSPAQINYQIPPGTLTGPATVTVTSGDGAVSTGSVQITTVAPGLFTANSDGQGVPAALALRLSGDGAQTYEPVARFDAAAGRFVAQALDLGPSSDTLFLILFGTGLRFRSSLAPVFASIGGTSVPVEYAGPQGGFVGLDQVNLRVPRSLVGRGEVDVVLVVEGQTANTVKVNIK